MLEDETQYDRNCIDFYINNIEFASSVEEEYEARIYYANYLLNSDLKDEWLINSRKIEIIIARRSGNIELLMYLNAQLRVDELDIKCSKNEEDEELMEEYNFALFEAHKLIPNKTTKHWWENELDFAEMEMYSDSEYRKYRATCELEAFNKKN